MSLVALCSSLLIAWNGGFARGEVDPTAGEEYLHVSPSGLVTTLTSARQLPLREGADLPGGQIALAAAERIEAGPWFAPAQGGGSGGVLWVQVRAGSGSLLRGLGLGGASSPSDISSAVLPVVGGVDESMVAWCQSGQVKIGTISAWASASAVASPGFSPVMLATSSDSLLAVSVQGSVSIYKAGVWSQAVPNAGTDLSYQSAWTRDGQVLSSGVDPAGNVLVWLNGSWHSFGVPGTVVAIANASDGSTSEVRLRLLSGTILDWDVIAAKRSWVLRTPLQRLGFLRTARGIHDGANVGMSPGGSGVLTRTWSRIWGLFHHRRSLAVSDLSVTPKFWSPSRGTQLIRIDATGSTKAFWSVDVVAESTEVATAQSTLATRMDLSTGWNDLSWSGTGLASGRYWVRSRISDSNDSLLQWERFRLDREGPVARFALSTAATPSHDTLRLGRTAVRVALVSASDLPFDATGIRYSVEFAGRTSIWDPATPLTLSVYDAQGVHIQDGSYPLVIKATDSAGNTSEWQGSWMLAGQDGGDSIAVNRFRVASLKTTISGTVLPVPVKQRDSYKAQVRLRFASVMEPGTASVQAPDGSEVACTGWSDASKLVAPGSERSETLTCTVMPNQSGFVRGANALRVVFRTADDSVFQDLPVLIDSLKTMITFPYEGSTQVGTVPVRGIAAAPDLGNGFVGYRVWARKGVWSAPDHATRWDELLGSGPWLPLVVPTSSQALTTPTTPTAFDAAWPKSNIGVQDRASDGLLAWFGPVEDTGIYTVLVATETSAGLASWDVKHFRWVNSVTSPVRLNIVDSSKILRPADPAGLLRLDNEKHDDDSLIWLLTSSGGELEGEGILYQPGVDGRPVGDRIIERRRMFLNNNAARWVQNGTSSFGASLDSGAWVWRFELWNNVGVRIDTSIQFQVIPELKAEEPVLTADPAEVSWTPGTGSPEAFQLRVQMSKQDTIRLLIESESGILIKTLVDSLLTQNGSWAWRADTATPGTYRARLRALGNNGWVDVATIPLILRKAGDILGISVPVLNGDRDSSLDANVTSNFKFRAKAHGALTYYPDRFVDYAPEVSGDQSVRRFLTVPWGLDYIKFYNSLEVFSEGEWNLRSYEWHCCESNEHHERLSSVPGKQRNTLWASKWHDRWRIQLIKDSTIAKDSFGIRNSAFITAKKVLQGPAYFGDAPWIPLMENSVDFEMPANQVRYVGKVNDLAIRGCGPDGVFGCRSNDYPGFAERDTLEKLRVAGNHVCPYENALNNHPNERTDNCKVIGRTNEIPQPGDSWKGINSGHIHLRVGVRSKSNFAEIVPGAIVFSMDGMRSDGIDPRGIVRINSFIQRIGNEDVFTVRDKSAPRIFWTKRDRSGTATSSSYSLNDDNWEDDEEQATFVGLPEPDWNSPHLMLHGRIYDSLNYAAFEEKDGRWFPDYFAWTNQANPQDSANCWEAPGGAHDTCLTSFSGAKAGLRGFAFQPIVPGIIKEGQLVPQYRYISNYFDRSRATGMAAWAQDLSNPLNVDTLQFYPKLNISDSMMGITWDTLRVPYPFVSQGEAGDWRIEKRNDRIIAHMAERGISYFPFTQDSTKFLRLVAKGTGLSGTGTNVIDSTDIALDSLFAPMLSLTDSSAAQHGKKYGYVFRKSLKWNVPLRSWRIESDGRIGALDDASAYHSVQIIDEAGHPIVARIKYLDRPVALGDWSSELDTTFRRTQGWLYGQGSFNESAFHGRNEGVHGGFLKMFPASQFQTFSPSSISPFVRDSNGQAAWNPNLVPGSLNWDLEVYYPDGSTRNLDLGLPADKSVKETFLLQMDPTAGAKSWIPLRGAIPETLQVGSQRLGFNAFWVKVRRNDDTSSWVSLPVNRFLTHDSLGGERGVHRPAPGADPWEGDSALPALAWWDVSASFGKYEVMTLVDYRASGDTTPHLLVDRRTIQIGNSPGATGGEIESPYKRAQLTIPAGTQPDGASIQLEVLASQDLKLPAKSPLVAPLGPVVRVHTDGNKTFDTLPTLQFRLAAREIFELEGRTDFETVGSIEAMQYLRRVASNYRLHVLSEEGKLDALPTLVTFGGDSTDLESITVTLQAQVPHFSWIFVQKDDGHAGRYPRFVTVKATAAGVAIHGTAEDGAKQGIALYTGRSIPVDLGVSWSLDTSLSGHGIASLPVRRLPVGLDGWFRDTIPWSVLPVGRSLLLVHYDSSQIADRRVVLREADSLSIANFEVAPKSFIPSCGLTGVTAKFDADRTDTVLIHILDSLGGLLSERKAVVVPGSNSISWDGCFDGRLSAAGVYRLEFLFPHARGQDRAASVGLGRNAFGLISFEVTPTTLVPSLTDPAHGITYSLVHTSTPDPIHLRARQAGKVIALVPSSHTDTLTTGFWSGIEQGVPLKGTWQVEAVPGTDSLQKLDATVTLLDRLPPTRRWQFTPDTLKGQSISGSVTGTVSEPMQVSLRLELNGSALDLIQPSTSVVVRSQQRWNWSGNLSAGDLRVIARWSTLDGLQSGIDSLELPRASLPPAIEVRGITPSTDTLWQDVTYGLRKLLGKAMPERLDVQVFAKRPVHIITVVKDSKGREVRRDTVNVFQDAQVSWNGKASNDSALKSGRYTVTMNSSEGDVILDRTFLLHRLPDLVVVKDSKGAAGRIAEAVLSLDSTILVSVWPDSVAVAYMEANPTGAVILTRGGVDSVLVTAHPWSPAFRFVRSGGHFGVLGGWPGVDLARLSAGDSVFPAWNALAGLASPYADQQTMRKVSSRTWTSAQKANWIDSSVLSDIHLVDGQRTLQSRGIEAYRMSKWPGVWMPLSGYDTVLMGNDGSEFHVSWHHSLYFRPVPWNGNADSSGAVLAVHPYALGALADSMIAEQDLARLVVRFFFSNDLFLQRSKLVVQQDTIRPGGNLSVTVTPQFQGDITLDSAVVKITTGIGRDTNLVFRHVRTGQSISQTVIWPWDSTWAWGDHQLSAELLPFVQYSQETGDTIREGNLTNNRQQHIWVMADTAKPKVVLANVVMGRTVKDWSGRAEGAPFVAKAFATTRHGLPPVAWTWKVLSNGATLQRVISDDSEASVTQNFEPLSSSLHGKTVVLRAIARDVFGNTDSAQANVRVDSALPKILKWEIVGGAGNRDAGSTALRTFSRPVSITVDTLLGQAIDEGGAVTLEIRALPRLTSDAGLPPDSTQPIQTVSASSGQEVTFEYSAVSTAWHLKACDNAGNCETSWMRALRDTVPPLVQVWKTSRTWLDSLHQDTSVSPSLVQRRSLLLETKDTTVGNMVSGRWIDPRFSHLWIGKGGEHAADPGSWSYVEETGKGRIYPLVIDGVDDGNVAIRLVLDGEVLADTAFNPYLIEGTDSTLPGKYRSSITSHQFQRFVRIPIRRNRQELRIEARDSAGHLSVATIFFETSEADLQTIDSAGDATQGADWGEVYMRRDHLVSQGSTNPETWDYWLLHRRNALAVGEVDNGIYRLIVDADQDTSTGDRTPATGFRGADVAIEWGPQNRADDGSAVQFRKLVWDAATSGWISSTLRTTEGSWSEEGISLDLNQADDPATDIVGEGDQRLPRGTIAKASGGMTEIGLRNGNGGSLEPIRWAVVPVHLASDTVRDSSGGMLSFTPSRFRSVTVDGLASDWGSDLSTPEVESYSETSSNEPGKVRLWLSNPGTIAVDVAKVVYWVRSAERPEVVMDSVPAGRHATVTRIVEDSTKGLGQWRIEIGCGSCLLVGGTLQSPLGNLTFANSGSSLLADDWSQSTSRATANSRLPLHAADGHILWGSEPPATAIREPLAVILPHGPVWVQIGQALAVRADSSFDPEGQPLQAVWRFEGLGRTDTGWSTSVTFDRPGLRSVSLEVRDRLHPNRKAWASLDVYVTDSTGSLGSRPVRESSLVVFDDHWNTGWDQAWETPTFIRGIDSVWSPSGLRLARMPTHGDSLLSLPLDSNGWLSIRARCDSTYWIAQGSYWCHDGLNLSKFTNLEFDVATDAGLRRPVRIWITSAGAGQGNATNAEEDFAYVATYLPDPSRPQDWQHVSIPLKEIFTEPERTDGFLKIKIMADDRYRGNGPLARVLLDQIELVRYHTLPSEIVTTRRTGLQVMANTQDPTGFPNQLGMSVRLLNAGSLPIAIDSLRARFFFSSRAGEQHGDTLWGPETPIYSSGNSLPIDSTIDPASFAEVQLNLDSSSVGKNVSLTWFHPGPRRLALRTTASASFWIQVGSYHSKINGYDFWGAPLLRYSGTRSLHWSWPDSSDIWQTAPHIVIEGLKPDGTWGRLWGLGPDEDPQSVQFWNRENLVDPSTATVPAARIQAHIRIVSGFAAPGEHMVLSGDSTIDPMGHALTFHWIDDEGHVQHIGPSWEFDLPSEGRVTVHLRVFDASDLTRGAHDSLELMVTQPGVAVDSHAVLTGSTDAWRFQEAWGPQSSGVAPTWVDSVTLPSRDGNCSVRLRPAGSGRILRVPFGNTGYTGVRFGIPKDSLNLAHWTHLEFWVASERQFALEADRERPVRMWLTHQTVPSPFDNHVNAGEEDFNLLQAYLADGRLGRAWQKVSIPLDELIQIQSTNLDSTQWFFKLMKNYSNIEADTSRDGDLFLSGIRLARYSGMQGRVTTRRVGAVVMGTVGVAVRNNAWIGPVRLLNTSARSLHSDSLRMRFLLDRSMVSALSWGSNYGAPGPGSDESVDPAWVNSGNFVTTESTWTNSVLGSGRRIDGERDLLWTTSNALIKIRGVQGSLSVGWQSILDTLQTPWSLPWRTTGDDLLLTRTLLERKQANGTWVRLWGQAPGESWRGIAFDGGDRLVIPSDTSTFTSWTTPLGCDDTGRTPQDTVHPPADTGSGANSTTAGAVQDLPSMGRDGGMQRTSVVVAGQSGVAIQQTRPDFSVSHRFIFDTAWAHRDEVLIDIFVPADQMTQQGSWIGTLSVADQTWSYLTPNPSGELSGALGVWKTFRYRYDPTHYQVGQTIDLMLLANAHAGTGSELTFVVGRIRLEDDATSVGGSGSSGDSSGSGNSSPSATNAIAMDSLTGWSQCNLCSVVPTPAGGTGIAVTPNGGGVVLERTVVVDSAFRVARAFEMDAYAEFPVYAWNSVTVVFVNGTSNQWWDAHDLTIPSGVGQSPGTRIRIPFDGSLYQLGTATTLKIVVNAYAPAGQRILFDNLRWVP